MQDRHVARSARPLEGHDRVPLAQDLQEQFQHGESWPVQRRGIARAFRLQVDKRQATRGGERFSDVECAEPISLRGERRFANVSFPVNGGLMLPEAFKRPSPFGFRLLPRSTRSLKSRGRRLMDLSDVSALCRPSSYWVSADAPSMRHRRH